MFRYFKLFILSIILLILLIPTWMSSLAFYDYKFNSWPPDFFKDYEHLIEGDYGPDDEIRIIEQYCFFIGLFKDLTMSTCCRWN